MPLPPPVLTVCYVPFWDTDAHAAYDHALRYTMTGDGSYFIDVVPGAEYAALCGRFVRYTGEVNDRTGETPE